MQFTGLPAFGTGCTMTVIGVTSRHHDRDSEFRHEFTTAAGAFTSLDRADPAQPGPRDRIASIVSIVSIGVSGGEWETIVDAERLQEFVMFSGAVAIAIHGEDGAGSLTAFSLAHCATQSLGVPRNVTLDAIGSAPDSGILDFTVTSLDRDAPEDTSTLFTVDREGPRMPLGSFTPT